MADTSDAQLQLKKRARRRLVGAIAFAGLAAVVLPMVMDEEPKQQVQDIQIRIPGQDQTPFAPKAQAARPAPVPVPEAEKPLAPPPVEAAPLPPTAPAVKPAEKMPAKAAEKTPEKAVDKPARAAATEAQRAAAILGGKVPEAVPANGAGPYVILIGAFANPANVKLLQRKLGELGVKIFTEPLDSPQGKKIRVRAGPFPNREAADKALDRMKRIGVVGVVAAKQ